MLKVTLLFCLQNYKKRRIVGRVKCKNIRSECPKPDCAEPQLLPGRCCKVCSGQTNSKSE
jgi:chordin